MDRSRLIRCSALATGVLLVGACGSAASTRGTAPPTTSAPPARLELAASAAASSGAAAVPSGAGAEPAIFAVGPTRYVLDAPLANLAPHAIVRALRPHAVNEADVRRIAQALDLTGTAQRSATGWTVSGPASAGQTATLSVIVENGDAQVSYDLGITAGSGAGASSGSNGSTVAVPPGAPTGVVVNGGPQVSAPPAATPALDVPDAPTATSIAHALLARVGVLGDDTWSTQVVRTGGVGVACAPGEFCDARVTQITARTVTFTLMLDGAPVDGVDWTVTIGAHGRVEGLFGDWATPTLVGSYALQTTAAAFAALQHGSAHFAGVQPMTATAAGPVITPAPTPGAPTPTPIAPVVHVTGVSLGVAGWQAVAAGRTVTDLVPVYRFHTRTNGVTSDIEVLALDPRVASFTNPPIVHPLPSPPIARPITKPGGLPSSIPPISNGASGTPTAP